MKLCVEMKKITKRFDDVVANDDVNFSACSGDVHSIVGGNGAGKTTLMKILYGLIKPDKGEIFINGEKAVIRNSRDAISKDIGMIHQEFLFVENMDAVDNIILGKEPVKNLMVDKKKAKEEIIRLQDRYHLFFNTDKNVSELSMGERQRIEIVKVLYRNAKILILDEPTGILTPQESKELFNILRALKNSGSLIIFISHKLNEVLEVSDKISIMRAGKIVDTLSSKDADLRELTVKMVGAELPSIAKEQSADTGKIVVSVKALHPKSSEGVGKPPPRIGEALVSVDNLSLKDKNGKELLKNISFEIKSSEIFGIAGIQGNGQKELEECLTGNLLYTEGKISIKGETLDKISPKSFKNKGISWIPSNRNDAGLISSFRLYENFILGYHNDKPFSSLSILNYDKIYKSGKEIIENYDITPPDINRAVENLSGGNQQKVLLGRELSKNPLFLVAAHPTRGVDIKGTWFIHNKLREIKKIGSAVLLISSDLEELFMLCDRIGVIYNGEIIDIVAPEKITFEEIGILMLGGKTQVPNASI